MSMKGNSFKNLIRKKILLDGFKLDELVVLVVWGDVVVALEVGLFLVLPDVSIQIGLLAKAVLA